MKLQKPKQTMIIGSVASLALLLAVGLSASAVAGGKGKGPHASIGVLSVCNVDNTDPANAKLVVDTTITDIGSASAPLPYIVSSDIKAVLGIGNNKGGDKWMVTALPRDEDATDPLPTGTVDGSVEFTSTFSLCGDPHAATANAARVDLTIEIVGGHKTWFSHCDDDPATDETEGSVPLGHLGICPQ